MDCGSKVHRAASTISKLPNSSGTKMRSRIAKFMEVNKRILGMYLMSYGCHAVDFALGPAFSITR